MKKILTTVIVLYLALGATGQVNISYPQGAESLDVCRDSSELEVSLTITDIDADNASVTVNLPNGIVYIAGSLVSGSSNNGLTIAEGTISDLNQPTFTIAPADLVNGDQLTFTLTRTAECSALVAAQGGAVFKDSIIVETDAGMVSEENPLLNTYDVLFPSISLLTPIAVTGAVNSTHDRDIKITNGGFGCLNEVSFYCVNTDVTHNSLTASGTIISSVQTSGDTTFYLLDAAIIAGFGNGDACFDNGEEITLVENFTINNCAASTVYNASWGCNGSVCQEQSKNGQINISNGVPNISTQEVLVSSGNSCVNAVFEVTYTNNGTEASAGAGTAYGMIFKFGMGYSNSILYQTFEHYTNFSVGGVALADTLVNGYGNLIDSPHFVNMAELTSDPDGAGVGLDDLDGDGQYDDLPVGASVVIRVEVEYACETACPSEHYYQRFQNQTCYLDQCSTPKETAIISRSDVLSYYEGSDGTTTNGPTDVTDNEVITFEVCHNYRLGIYGGLGCPTDTVSLRLILPSGITYSGNPTMDGSAATGSVSGDTLLVSGELNNGASLSVCFTTDLTFSCADWNGDALDIPTQVVYNCDNSCDCIQQWGCDDLNLVPHCPGCVDGGLTTNYAWSERLSLGYADPSGTSFADPATLNPGNLKIAMPCDSVRIYATSEQIGATTYDNAFLQMKYTMLGGVEAFNVTGGQVDIVDVSTGITYTCDLPPFVKTTVVDTVFHNWDFTTLIGDPACGIPAGFMFEQNDSVNVYVDVKIAENPALDFVPANTLSGLRFKHYNIDPITSEERYCDTWGAELYLHKRDYILWVGSGGVNNGCNSYSNWMSFRFRHGASDIYPGEIRPYSKVDSFVVTINNGDIYDPSVVPVIWSRGTPEDGYPGDEIITNLSPPIISGNKLIWVNDGSWPLGDMIVTDHSAYYVLFNLMTTCGSVNGTVNYKVYSTAAGDFDDASCYKPVLNQKDRIITNRQPVLAMTDLTGCISATKPIEYWDLEVRNTTGARDAEYVWVGFEDLLSGVNVVNVLDLTNGGTALPLLNYANGKWVELTSLLTGGSTHQIRVEFEYTSCDSEELRVLSSFDCGVYPTDPTELNCTPFETILEIKPAPSEVQINRLEWPMTDQELCDTLFYEIEINSAQLAYLVDPTVEIAMTPGLSFQSDPEVQYPGGTGTWESVAPAITGALAEIDLSMHSAISSTGIPGTQDALAPEERNVRVRFSFITDCNFFAGSKFQFSARGNSPCTEAAIGDGVTSITPPINIIGVTAPYTTTNTIAVPSTFTSCSTSESIGFNVTFSGGASTQPDTAIITLPADLEYDPSSFACTSAAVFCPTFVEAVTDVSGITTVKLVYPAGIPNGTVIDYTLDVNATTSSGCSEPNIKLENIINIAGPACATDPTGFCPEIGVVSGDALATVTIEKPNLTLDDLCGSYLENGGSLDFTLDGAITNTGAAVPAGDSIFIEVFCADSLGQSTGSAIGVIPVPGPIAVNATVIFNGDVSGMCDAENGIVSIISKTGTTGIQNCMCNNESEFYCNQLVLPVECSSFNALAHPDGVMLTWTTATEVDNKGFYIERSRDGVNFEIIGWEKGAGESIERITYTYLDDNIFGDVVYYYRLVQEDLNGVKENACSIVNYNGTTNFSENAYKVFPNPTNNSINIATYSVDQGKDLTINIHSSIGQLVYSGEQHLSYGFNNFNVNVSQLSPGIYFVLIESSDGGFAKYKIVKANE